jgi:hypothetical protein
LLQGGSPPLVPLKHALDHLDGCERRSLVDLRSGNAGYRPKQNAHHTPNGELRFSAHNHDHVLSLRLKIDHKLAAYLKVPAVVDRAETRTSQVVLDICGVEAVEEVKGPDPNSAFMLSKGQPDLSEHLQID